MTRSRKVVEESLAARGRPQMWADDHEAAVLSGMSLAAFLTKRVDLERRGFPAKNADNGKRSIPAILAFWKLAASEPVAESQIEDGREVENWDDPPRRRRHILR